MWLKKTKTYTKAQQQLANELSGGINGLVTPGQIVRLLSLARAYNRLQERFCSVDMSAIPGAQEQAEKRENRLEIDIKLEVAQVPCITRVTFSGDPRGYCVHLFLLDERYNTWGGKESGFGIG